MDAKAVFGPMNNVIPFCFFCGGVLHINVQYIYSSIMYTFVSTRLLGFFPESEDISYE